MYYLYYKDNHWGKPDGVTAVTPSFNMDASQEEDQTLLDFYVIRQVVVMNHCQYDVTIGKEQN